MPSTPRKTKLPPPPRGMPPSPPRAKPLSPPRAKPSSPPRAKPSLPPRAKPPSPPRGIPATGDQRPLSHSVTLTAKAFLDTDDQMPSVGPPPTAQEGTILLCFQRLYQASWWQAWVQCMKEWNPGSFFEYESGGVYHFALVWHEWHGIQHSVLTSAQEAYSVMLGFKPVKFRYMSKKETVQVYAAKFGAPGKNGLGTTRHVVSNMQGYCIAMRYYQDRSMEAYKASLLWSCQIVPGMFISAAENGGYAVEMCWSPLPNQLRRYTLFSSQGLERHLGLNVRPVVLGVRATIQKFQQLYPSDFQQLVGTMASGYVMGVGGMPIQNVADEVPQVDALPSVTGHEEGAQAMVSLSNFGCDLPVSEDPFDPFDDFDIDSFFNFFPSPRTSSDASGAPETGRVFPSPRTSPDASGAPETGRVTPSTQLLWCPEVLEKSDTA